MKKVFFIATSLFLLNNTAANACSCMPTTPEQSFKNSNAVFAGKVINVVEPRGRGRGVPSPSLNGVKVIFAVSKVWKGKPTQQIVITTPDSSASCGYNFEKGQDYLVYASTQENALQTGLCSGTKTLSTAQADLTVLGKGETPTAENLNVSQQLQRSKQLWARQKISNYRFTLRRSCFCLPKATEPVMITIRRGKVTSLVAASNGQPTNPEYFEQYNSIPKLFDMIQDAIAKKAHRISVTYHPTLGYPTQISIDYNQQIADEELSLTVDQLRVMK